MNNKKQLVILIVAGILILLVGVCLGVFLQTQKVQIQKSAAANGLASKVVTSIVGYGQVKKIDGRNITLSNLGDNLTIAIINNAQVYSFAIPAGSQNGAAAPVQQEVSFGDIKVGDHVNIAVTLLPTGLLEGSSVIILP
jgi:hypothetical protein